MKISEEGKGKEFGGEKQKKEFPRFLLFSRKKINFQFFSSKKNY